MAQVFITDDLPIRVTARGVWLHGTEPLHPRVQTLFARNIFPTSQGHYRVQLGHAKADLEVDDTPYFARSVALRLDVHGKLVGVNLLLSDESEEDLHLDTLMQSRDNVFYCRILRHDWWVPCRWTPGQYHSLAMHLDLQGTRGALVTDSAHWPIAEYDARPLPASQTV